VAFRSRGSNLTRFCNAVLPLVEVSIRCISLPLRGLPPRSRDTPKPGARPRILRFGKTN